MGAQDTITAFLRARGLTDAQIAGVEGNLEVESGFSPTNLNPAEHAIGLAQWEGPRRTALQAYARTQGTTETDLGTQLGFMWHELQTSESGALSALRATDDPGTAAAVFDAKYERSDGTARPQRVAAARSIAQSLNDKPAAGGLSFAPVGFSDAGNAVGALISPGGALASAVGGAAVDKTAQAVAPLVYRGAALLLAGGLVVAGLYRAFAPTVRARADNVSTAAGSAAKLAALA